MADRVGQQLGNYRLIRLLGRGGFAEVYLGEHQRLKTQAAIKVLRTQLAEDDIEGFLKEARFVAHLEHPHIVRVLDFDVEESTPFLVMSYAPNGNLRQRHAKGTKLPLDIIISYVKQIGDALQYAHNEKLIHRDIKPENMLVGQNNNILLSDFGIALVAQSSRFQSTQEVIGTAVYMSPEQLQGKPRLASDQYSLGIVVYEWLCGERPFSGTFSELYSQHLFVHPPLLHMKLPTILPDVEKVVLKALAKEPQERFTSIQEFANALEQACQPKPIILSVSPSTLPLSQLTALPIDENVYDSSEGVEDEDSKKKTTSPRIVLTMVILTLLIIVSIVYFVPSADVTVTLLSQSFSSPMKLTATGISRQDVAQHTLPAQTLVFESSAVQLGHASGSTTVGTIQAKGNVVFTNTGASQVVIPQETPVATKSGIQFTTTAEALALPNSTILVPIQAQNPGVNSNVPPNTITMITSEGLLKIQQANPGVTLNLSIVNTDPTTGGTGNATSVTSVTMHDVNTVKSALDTQLQAEVKDFLNKHVQAGDEQGKPMQVETVLANPPVNHVATDGTFTETLKLHMSVLVVRFADLQIAATAQFKDALNKQHRDLALVQQAVELQQVKNVPAADGKSLILSFTAQGQVAPVVSEDAVRSLVSGKTRDDAKQSLTGNGGIPGILNPQITVYPGFFHWLPFWQQRITVHFKTVQVTAPVLKKKRK